MLRTGTLLLIVVLAAATAWPQQGTPVGPEFRVNMVTAGGQGQSAVASNPSGAFVVVWTGPEAGFETGVFGRAFDSFGAPTGPEFRANTFFFSYQNRPAVAVQPLGNFLVVWTSNAQDMSATGVFGQRFNSFGAPIFPEFRVNTFTPSFQEDPAVAMDAAGNAVVVWMCDQQDGSFYGVCGQRFDSLLVPLGPEFRVNTYTTGVQYRPAVASDASGNFVVVWSSYAQDGSNSGVFGQRFNSTGAPIGPEFLVNAYTTGPQFVPSVASDSSGNFIVTWSGLDGSASGLFGQRYASSGGPLGPEFRVNTFTTGYQRASSLAADASGNFVVVWDSEAQDGSAYGVFGQRYASSGAPLGGEFRVNTYTTNIQGYPTVSADSPGNFVVTWASVGQSDPTADVYGQRYNQIVPVELMRFGVE